MIGSFESIVILGFSGSGKTTLSRSLSALPRTVEAYEYVLMCALGQVYGAIESPHIQRALRKGVERNLHTFVRSPTCRGRFARLHRALTKASGFFDFVSRLMDESIERLIYESNFMTFCPELITSALPQAKFLCLQRDGRDCARIISDKYHILTDTLLVQASTSEVLFSDRRVGDSYIPWWVDQGEEEVFLSCPPCGRALWMWQAMERRVHAFAESQYESGSQKIMFLNYEDLLNNPAACLDAVEQHLGFAMTREVKRRWMKTAALRQKSSTRFDFNHQESDFGPAWQKARPVWESLGYK